MTRRPLPRARVVATSTLALFLAVSALLVYQLRSGRDPALGGGTVLAQAPVPPPKRILVRKIIITRVVVHLPDEAGAAAAPVALPARPVASAPPVASTPPIVSRPAPAPAPAPAPLSTRSS